MRRCAFIEILTDALFDLNTTIIINRIRLNNRREEKRRKEKKRKEKKKIKAK